MKVFNQTIGKGVEYVVDPEMKELYDYVISLGKVPEKLGEEPEDPKNLCDGDKFIIFLSENTGEW